MKKYFSLGAKASDIFVVVYLLGTLYARFLVEDQLQGHFLVSVLIGAFALLFLWALNKSGYINPTWFGLFSSSDRQS